MSGWTLGQVKAMNLQLEASCRAEGGCRRFFVFDLDRLIKSVGADYALSDIPPMTCEECGRPLKIELASVPPSQEKEQENEPDSKPE
jgi:hypothetical protein